MFKRRVKWKSGDFFGVPLDDGLYGLGQIISLEADAMNSVVCAFFLAKAEVGSIDASQANVERLLSVCFVTRDLLDSGLWPILSAGVPIATKNIIDLDEIRRAGYVGVKIIGSANVNRFMNACYGMFPWDGLHDKQYFDKILVDPIRKPPAVVYKGL